MHYTDKQLIKMLRTYFGFDHFKDGQLAVIKALLQKKDTLAVLPTGTGKSLCYQFIGGVWGVRVVIISPLLSLMADQVQQLQLLGFKHAVAITSALLPQEKAAIISRLKQYQFIFLAPEMLQNQAVLAALQRLTIGLLVIDEAHCISAWGYDFRLQYTQLAHIRHKLKNPLTLALTATASANVQQDIIKQLTFKNFACITNSADRPNIFLQRINVAAPQEKFAVLTSIVSRLAGSGIIYFSSKKITQKVASQLANVTSKSVAVYHADVDSDTRLIIQQQFINDQIDILCATSAFGMGINKKNIRYVIHYHVPANIASYLQEVGRAGRDGKTAVAVALNASGDEALQEKLQFSLLPNESYVKEFFKFPKQLAAQPEFELVVQLFQANYTESQINRYLAARRTAKREQLVQMHMFLTTNGCLRRNVLLLLGQQLPLHSKNCCSTDNHIPSEIIKRINAISGGVKNKTYTSIEQSWQQLFNQPLQAKKY